jgi:hypothetical protein
MVVNFVSPEGLRRAVGSEKPILLVTTWAGMQSVSADSAWMRTYIENGGNLMIVPSVRAGQVASSGKYPEWLGASIKPREMYARGIGLEVLNETSNFWNRIRQSTESSKLESVSGFVFHPLALSSEYESLLGIDFQKVVIAQKKMGKGNVFVSGTAFSSRWNTLPSSGLFVMIAQRMALTSSSSSQEGTMSLVAGERPRGISADGGEIEVLSLVGDSMNWKGSEQQMPSFPRVGVYLVTAGDKKYCLSVRASEKEGSEKYIEDSEVATLGQIENKVLPFDESADFEQYHRDQAKSVGLFLPLLLLATLALIAEGWLGAPRLSQGVQEKASEISEDGKGGLLSPVSRLSRQVRNIFGRSGTDTTTERRAS